MIIKRMRASFGRLSGELELRGGMNIVAGPNESGKSTWCQFLRVMLYGVPPRDREIARFEPWSGAAMEGSADIEADGRLIRLERATKRGRPMSVFSAQYADTGENVPHINEHNAGLLLTGLDRDSFTRSVFIMQGGLELGKSAELEQRIQALATTGDDNVVPADVRERLRNWRNQRRSYPNTNVGRIPALERELAEASGQLARVTGTIAEYQACAAALDAARVKTRALDAAAARAEAQGAREQLSRLNSAREEAARARERLDGAQKAAGPHGFTPNRDYLSALTGALDALTQAEYEAVRAGDAGSRAREEAARAEREMRSMICPALDGLDADEQEQRLDSDMLTAQNLDKRRKAALWPVILCAAGALLAAVVVLAREPWDMISWAVLGLGLAFTIAAAVGGAAVGSAAGKFNEIMRSYNARDLDGARHNAAAYARLWADAEAGRAEAAERLSASGRLEDNRNSALRAVLDTAKLFDPSVNDAGGVLAVAELCRTGLEELEACAFEYQKQRARYEGMAEGVDAAAVERLAAGAPAEDAEGLIDHGAPAALARQRSEEEELSHQLASLGGKLGALPPYDQITGRISGLEAELERLEFEYRAIRLAEEILSEAEEELNRRVAPGLNRRAGEILFRLTGGRRNEVILRRGFDLLLPEGPAGGHDAVSLSHGARDQVYLALRLAIGDMINEGRPAPLIFDDTFCYYDKERLAHSLEYLYNLSRERQVVIFTCRETEALILRGHEGVNVVTLG